VLYLHVFRISLAENVETQVQLVAIHLSLHFSSLAKKQL